MIKFSVKRPLVYCPFTHFNLRDLAMGVFQLTIRLCLAAMLSISMIIAIATNVSIADSSSMSAVEAELFEQLAAARSESEGRATEGKIWQYWFSLSPTADVRTLLDNGRERREAYDYETAENLFDSVVEAAPDYFEGYNQRAFVRFLRENYDGALADLETTLALKPDHFGALSGMYHTLRVQNRHELAMQMLVRAVTVHPWIQERGALPKSLWPESFRVLHEPGQEI